jgi:hypothetical protein
MLNITTVGLDLAKNVFQEHGADVSGRAVLNKKMRLTYRCASLDTSGTR